MKTTAPINQSNFSKIASVDQDDRSVFTSETGILVLYRDMFANSDEAVLLIDYRGQVIDVSQKVEEISGYNRADLVGRSSLSLARLLTRKGPLMWFKNPLGRTSREVESPHEIDIHTKIGERFTVRLNQRILSRNGKAVGRLIGMTVLNKDQTQSEPIISSQDAYKSLIDHVGIGVFRTTVGITGKFLEVNPAMEEITGYSRKELLSMNAADLYVHPEERVEIIRQVLAGELKEAKEVLFRKKDGTIITVRDKKIAVTAVDGYAIYLEGFLEDITERNKALKALQESKQKFKELADQLPQIVCEFDLEGNVVFVNQNALKAFGYSEKDLRSGLTIWNMIDASDLEKAMRNANKVFNGESLPGKEYLAKRKDGQTFPVFLYSNPVIHGGTTTGLRIIAFDATDQKATEQTLRFSDAAFKSIREGIFAMDNKGIITHWNVLCEEMFGIKARDAIGKNFSELIQLVEDYPGQNQERLKLLMNKKYNQEEQVYRTPRGDVWVDIHSQAIENDGQVTGWVTIAMDITNRKKSEEKLRESEELYRTLIAASPSGIVQTGIDGLISYISPKVLTLFGYDDVSEAIGRSPLEWITPEDQEKAHDNISRILSGETLGPNRYCLVRKDRTIFWGEISSSILRDKTGNPIGMMSVVLDITKRKQNEQEIIRREQLTRTLLVATNDMAHLIDEDGIIIEINEAMAKALRLSKEELVGTCVYDRYPGKNAEIRKQLVRDVISKQQQIRFLDEQNDKIYESSIYPIANAKGEKHQVAIFARDITERLQAESNLKRSAEEWRITFDSITDPISIIDADCKLLRVNKAFADMVGKIPGDVIGATCYDTVHKRGCPVDNCPHLETLKTKKPATREVFDRECSRILEVSTSPILDEKGAVLASVHLTRDVTGRRRIQEHLMLTDRLASIGELVSGIAHELNNPLTSVMGFSQLIMEKSVTDDVKEDLIIVNKEAQRAVRIVKGLLTFARKHTPVKESIQINQIIEDVLRLRSYEHKVSNIKVTTHYDPELPEIMVDYFQIQQVFLNVVINAEYFMIQAHNNGTLNITTENIGDVIRVSIADDGPGINPEVLNKIFDPFFTTKEVGQGTGLGLSICHGIMSEHNGRIYAQSEPGKGATFVLEFPIYSIESFTGIDQHQGESPSS